MTELTGYHALSKFPKHRHMIIQADKSGSTSPLQSVEVARRETSVDQHAPGQALRNSRQSPHT